MLLNLIGNFQAYIAHALSKITCKYKVYELIILLISAISAVLYLLNHETFISVLGIQDGIFLVWLLGLFWFFFTSAERNFQLKEVKWLFFCNRTEI